MDEDRIKLLKAIARELGVASRSVESIFEEISREFIEPIKKTAEESILEAFYSLEAPEEKPKDELVRSIYQLVEDSESRGKDSEEELARLIRRLVERMEKIEEDRENSRSSS